MGKTPARVPDHYRFWTEPPIHSSARLFYWLDRIADGWRPNRRISGMGYDSTAQWFGVYMWEYLNVIWPLWSVDDIAQAARDAKASLPPPLGREANE